MNANVILVLGVLTVGGAVLYSENKKETAINAMLGVGTLAIGYYFWTLRDQKQLSK